MGVKQHPQSRLSWRLDSEPVYKVCIVCSDYTLVLSPQGKCYKSALPVGWELATKFILNDYSTCYKTRLVPLMCEFELNDLVCGASKLPRALIHDSAFYTVPSNYPMHIEAWLVAWLLVTYSNSVMARAAWRTGVCFYPHVFLSWFCRHRELRPLYTIHWALDPSLPSLQCVI